MRKMLSSSEKTIKTAASMLPVFLTIYPYPSSHPFLLSGHRLFRSHSDWMKKDQIIDFQHGRARNFSNAAAFQGYCLSGQSLTLTYTNIQRGHIVWEPEHRHKQNKSAEINSAKFSSVRERFQ